MLSFKRLLIFFDHSDQKGLIVLCLLTFAMVITDIAGIASILPFVTMLTNPESINTIGTLNYFYENLGFDSIKTFQIALGAMFLFFIISSLALKAYCYYYQYFFSLGMEAKISANLLERYIDRSYLWHLSNSSTDSAKKILNEVSLVIAETMLPLITMVTNGLISVGIIIFLLSMDPWVTLGVGGYLFGLYFGIYKFLNKKIFSYGKSRVSSNSDRYRMARDSFSLIKEIKLYDKAAEYTQKFREPANIYSVAAAKSKAFGQLPRYLIEIVTFGGFVGLMLFLIVRDFNFEGYLAKFSVFVFAAYKLLPAMQQAYKSAISLHYSKPTLDSLYQDYIYKDNLETDSTPVTKQREGDVKSTFKDLIFIQNIVYKYPNQENSAIGPLSFNIEKGKSLALVGKSGSGKTTLVNLLLGLIKPTNGSINMPRLENDYGASLKDLVAYVPQDIYLLDDTLKANIVFADNFRDEDEEYLKRIISICELEELVSESEGGVDSFIGENGQRLSGGQRQRIGIARALYRKPKILVLDEATSALDNLTEKKIVDNLTVSFEGITTVMIAHRISSIKCCDRILLMEDGELAEYGDYEELINKGGKFNRLVNAGSLLK